MCEKSAWRRGAGHASRIPILASPAHPTSCEAVRISASVREPANQRTSDPATELVSGIALESLELSIVHAREQQQRGDRADERHEHVPLRVPDVALGAEEGVGGGAAEHRGEPLDQLVGGADGETDAARRGRTATCRVEGRTAEQDLARDDRGDEALREMAEAIVVVSRREPNASCTQKPSGTFAYV